MIEQSRSSGKAVITRSAPRASGEAAPGAGVPARLASEIRAIFAAARQRGRRRRRALLALLASAALAAAAAGYGMAAGASGGPGQHRPGRPMRLAAPTGLPPAEVAWFDDGGDLRIGNVATLAQRVVARVRESPCCDTVAAGGRLYWASTYRMRNLIQAYDLATGKIRTAARGWAVFPSATGRSVDVAQSATRLLELPAGGSGRGRRLVTPHGWHLVPLPWAVAGGFTVSSAQDAGGSRDAAAIGVWYPGTGRVEVIGRGHVLATYTPRSGHHGLVAWMPAGCGMLDCPIEITSTATRATLTVRSPLRHGFLGQGGDVAFSPDGRELVGYIGTGPVGGPFVPALADTATGTVRVIRRAVLANGESAAWEVWLPGGRLLAGPSQGPGYAGYAIDERSGSARRFAFFPGNSPDTGIQQDSPDIGYGAVLVPRSATRPSGGTARR
jgi:hypothetical protein